MFQDYFRDKQPDLTMEPGQRLFKEGDKSEKAFFVHSGVIEIFVKGNLVRTLGSGEIVGEMALVDDDIRRVSAVTGPEGATLFSVGKDQFRKLSSENPELSSELIKVITGRLRDMNRDSLVYISTLENMSDGVFTIDLTGKIIVCNDAAVLILGIADSGDEIVGKSIDEMFSEHEDERNDNFFQLILDAIHSSDIVQNRLVEFYNRGQVVKLYMTTSFLKTDERGFSKRNGVIAVFRDTTEIERLRETETKLTDELKNQHEQLQQAYIGMENSNQDLEASLKKIQTLRVFATVFVVGLFIAIGLYSWYKGPAFSGLASDSSLQTRREFITMTAAPKPISTIGSLQAQMLPIEEWEVKSAVDGVVEEVLFVFGQPVAKGYKLLSINNSKAKAEMKEATEQYINAVDTLTAVKAGKEVPDQEVRAVYEKTQKAVQDLEEFIRNSEVKAPTRGVVVAMEEQAPLAPGIQLYAGETLFSLADLEKPTFVAYVSRAQLPKIKVGYKVSISSKAFKDITLEGTVASVAPEEDIGSSEREARFVVEIEISKLTPEQKTAYRSGASLEATVEIFDKENALFMPISAVKVDGEKKWLQIWDQKQGKAFKVAVKTGVTTMDSVEILDGLKEGDEVVVR